MLCRFPAGRLALDMELAIARRTLQLREDSLTIIRNRERGGLGTILEVHQGEQLVHAAAQVIPDVEQLIEQTENQISLLLDGTPTTVRDNRRSAWFRIARHSSPSLNRFHALRAAAIESRVYAVNTRHVGRQIAAWRLR